MAASASPPVQPAVRLRPAPPLDPPFTDDPAPPWSGAATRQALLDPADERRRPRRARRAPVRPRPGRPAVAHPPSGQPTGTTPPLLVGASAEATGAARRFAATLLEFLNGYRPVAQIRSLANPTQAAAILEQLSRTMAGLSPPGRSSARQRIRIRALRACEPRAGVVEAAVVLSGPEKRVWAVAFRLEQQPGRWVATVLQPLC